jgi:alkaline phosphatase D
MKQIIYLTSFFILISSCQRKSSSSNTPLTIAIGSCSSQRFADKQLWKEIMSYQPSTFCWLGDAIYPKQYNYLEMDSLYKVQKSHPDYVSLIKAVNMEGCYDDHDYGMNDGGIENEDKERKKNLFLDFIDVPKNDVRRSSGRGIYYAKILSNKVKLVTLDTRYYRSKLTNSSVAGRRFEKSDKGNILDENQWKWITNELKSSKNQLVIIISSIQLLNDHHYYEKWGNFPHERKRMIDLLNSQPQNKYLVISGDRHFSEIMKINDLTEITCSGMTQVFSNSSEDNPDRISPFINEGNFGLLEISSFDNQFEVKCQFIGKDRKLLHSQKIELGL